MNCQSFMVKTVSISKCHLFKNQERVEHSSLVDTLRGFTPKRSKHITYLHIKGMHLVCLKL